MIDRSNLTEDQLGHLAYILASPAWLDYFEPMLRSIEKGYVEDLLAAPDTRPDKSDDYLRAGVLLVRSIIDLPKLQIDDYRDRKNADAMQRTEDEEYAERAANPSPAWEQRGPWDKDFPPEEDY
jgi:hypothetical protein